MLKNQRFLVLPALFAFGALLVVASPTAQAADKAPVPDPCSFASKFAQLRAIQADGSQDYIEAIRAQLAVRKAILRSVLDCALKDVTIRKAALDNVSDPEIKANLAQGLDESADYYATKRGVIDNLGIKGTQDTARDIATWRSSRYNALASEEDHMILWSRNQPLFDKASNRLDQLKPVVFSLKLVNQDDVQAKFTEAESELKDAEAKNDAAKEAILNGDASAPEAIKSSLEPLSTMYKKFLDLSDTVKKIVP